MITTSELYTALPQALAGVDLPFLGDKTSGKVRDIYRWQDQLIIVTTDRLSAFDRILGLVPFKGQVLNQLSAFWFEQTQSIVPNHLIAMPDPNVTIAKRCTALPVEVVVRGYITGVTSTALWYRYSLGERSIYGIDFADGLQKNDPLAEPIITPTTKGSAGAHDERITSDEVVSLGLVEAALWQQVCQAAIAIFKRGQEIARRAGLILVDTKYEFGIDEQGRLVLIDEVHTPDSSRYWIADSYEERRGAGLEPENFDKEFIRLHYASLGYRGDGEPPAMPAELAVQASQRYIRTFELLTGQTFSPGAIPAGERIAHNLRQYINK
ncbi:MAG: phosphoribosylaminoimidazolesuccinocarboxamide synthase [Caldilineaceae bacterium]